MNRRKHLKPKKTTGRPSKYSKELCNAICDGIKCGKGLRSICKEVKIDLTTVFEWMRVHEEFSLQYAQAREMQAELFADEIMEIADDGTNDFMEREAKSGKVFITADHENINRSRLRVDARKWVAAKLLPKKYGDRPAVVVNAAPVLDIGNLPLPDARATSKPN